MTRVCLRDCPSELCGAKSAESCGVRIRQIPAESCGCGVDACGAVRSGGVPHRGLLYSCGVSFFLEFPPISSLFWSKNAEKVGQELKNFLLAPLAYLEVYFSL